MDNNLSRNQILVQKGKSIHYKLARKNGYQLIDVRSAAEFQGGTIPGALNIPLFNDLERSVVGTVYHHGGHEQAIDKGFEYVESKLKQLLGSFEPYRGRSLGVFCARGGMRSLSIVNLLNQSGYDAFQLEGGYKVYRHDTLETLESFGPHLIVIHGLTGTGKTRIIKHLRDSLDLENLANHRSSLFGGLDLSPNNQRTFDSLLADAIAGLKQEPYFIEGESRKIGQVFIPKSLATAMKEAVLVNVDCSLETRIDRIIEDYPVAGDAKRQQILAILKSLKPKMGSGRVAEMCELFSQGKLRELVRILLLEYYDKRYKRSMSKYRFDLELSSENISEAASALTHYRTTHLKSI